MGDGFEVVLYVDGRNAAAAPAEQCLERARVRFPAAPFTVCDVSREPVRAAREGVTSTPVLIVRRNGQVRGTLVGTLYEEPLVRTLREAGLPDGGEAWEKERRQDVNDLGARLHHLERRLAERAQREAAMTLMLEQADLDTAAAHLFQAEQAGDEAAARRAIQAARNALKRWD